MRSTSSTASNCPSSLVEAEFNGIWNALGRRDEEGRQELCRRRHHRRSRAQEEYRAIAERRVRLGLVLGTLGEKEGIQVNEQELQQALMARARQFPGQEKQVFDHYRKNPNALIELRGPDLRAEGRRFHRVQGQGHRKDGDAAKNCRPWSRTTTKITPATITSMTITTMIMTMTTTTIMTTITITPRPSRRRNRLPKRPRRRTEHSSPIQQAGEDRCKEVVNCRAAPFSVGNKGLPEALCVTYL